MPALVPPAEPVISLDQAKAYLRVDGTEDDKLVEGLIAAAEAYTARALDNLTPADSTPAPVRQAMLLMVGHWYANRGDAPGADPAGDVAPGVNALLAPYRSWRV